MIILNIRVIPNASKYEIVGWLGDNLKIKVPAQAEKGKANKAVIELLSKELGIAKNTISLESGKKSQIKTLKIDGIYKKSELLELLKHKK